MVASCRVRASDSAIPAPRPARLKAEPREPLRVAQEAVRCTFLGQRIPDRDSRRRVEQAAWPIMPPVPHPKFLLLGTLLVVTLVFLTFWYRSARRLGGAAWPKPIEAGVGFITNFFDTLGIGSFAPTTSLFKLLRLVPDERI